jgi:hypothetical protein
MFLLQPRANLATYAKALGIGVEKRENLNAHPFGVPGQINYKRL